MTALVTGAAGFIGYHLCNRLLEGGSAVAGYDNLNDYYDPALKQARIERLRRQGFRFHHADLEDREALQRAFEQAGPAIVVHLAAQAGVRHSLEHPEEYLSSNVTGLLNLLEVCRGAVGLQHLIVASTSSVYGNDTPTPFHETACADRPLNVYAATKRSGELLCHCYAHLYGLPITALRLFTVYGPWGRPDMAMHIFSHAILSGNPINLHNEGAMIRDFTYIDDIIAGISGLLSLPPEQTPPLRIVNIGGGSPTPIRKVVSLLEGLLGRRARINLLPMQPGESVETRADVGELERLTGVRPATPIEEGIKRFVQWYRGYYGQ